jgi:hypothetical protein
VPSRNRLVCRGNQSDHLRTHRTRDGPTSPNPVVVYAMSMMKIPFNSDARKNAVALNIACQLYFFHFA